MPALFALPRLVFSLFCLLCFASSAHAWPAVVVKITDGDTVLVAPAGAEDAEIAVRLYGIDAPEMKQAGGKASKKALQSLLRPGDAVEVIGMNTDRYHRSAALIIRGKQTINYEMLVQGQAWVYPQYCKARFCRQWKKAESKARKEEIGVWLEDKPTPPWQWRKENKQEDSSGADLIPPQPKGRSIAN